MPARKHDLIPAIACAAICIAICLGWGGCKRWQYRECRSVGHGHLYCVAQTAGCFGRRK